MTSRIEPTVSILAEKHYDAPSAFSAENLLREARRQKGLTLANVPRVCVLDPDGDLVRQLKATGRAGPDPGWACYHTELCRFTEDGLELGVVGCAVGASFAVLVAEQLFASGCELLISMTSAGQLRELAPVSRSRHGHERHHPLVPGGGLRQGGAGIDRRGPGAHRDVRDRHQSQAQGAIDLLPEIRTTTNRERSAP